uniref:General transcription and DNA repair factor IIH helicase subunit XPD n=1 Tax=Strongyloides stercoralis TaxID=6248 RepID=A0AAF5DG82_STRER
SINVDGLEVIFPYKSIYPEQILYMQEFKKAIDSRGHGLIEMPSGTGKTSTILSLSVAYMNKYPSSVDKIVYCTRTIPEMHKTAEELRKLLTLYKTKKNYEIPITAVTMASRKFMCLNENVISLKEGSLIDGACSKLTASFVRARRKIENNQDPNSFCEYYENYIEKGDKIKLNYGVYTLDDSKGLGFEQKVCPYFYIRSVLNRAHIIIFSYHYMLDPKIAEIVSKSFSPKSIVIFDEAHNIDNVCIESMSVSLTNRLLERASKNLTFLENHVKNLRKNNDVKLQNEYEKLVQGLKLEAEKRKEENFWASPVLPSEILNEVVPGSIRKAEHFVIFMKRVCEFVKHMAKCKQIFKESPAIFLRDIGNTMNIERKPLRFAAERMQELMRTLELADISDFGPLIKLYERGWAIQNAVLNNPNAAHKNFDTVVHLSCLDASIAIRPVLERFQTVLITSGTLSPMEMFPKVLDFDPVIMASLTMTMSRPCILPMIISRGNDQIEISSRFENREEPSVVRNYGNLILDLAQMVPDGMVVFFTSYGYMENVVSLWYDQRIIDELVKYKLLFIETQDPLETAAAHRHYQHACDRGRGAVFFCVARGKVSEGIDFMDHYGRAVVMLGIPYVNTESRVLRARLEFLRDQYNVRENDFLTFDALRHAAQCAGRVLRGKSDYGIMIFADKRYVRNDKRKKLPKWIQECMSDGQVNLTIDEACAHARAWLPLMGQPFSIKGSAGVSLLTQELLESNPNILEKFQGQMFHIRHLTSNLSLKLNAALSVSGINTINLLHSSPIFLKGHSKWQNIKDTKGKNDSIKAQKINFLLSKVKLAIKDGGYDINSNQKLSSLLADFKANGLPLDSFHNYLKRMKEKPEVTLNFDVIGPSGAMFIIECETTSPKALESLCQKNFSRVGGFRFATSSIKNNFEEKGVITISGVDKNNKKLSLSEVEEAAIEYDVEEVEELESGNEGEGKQYELYCDKKDFYSIESKISESNFIIENAMIKMKAVFPISLSEEDMKKVEAFYKAFTQLEDVKNIFDNIKQE